MVRTTKRRNRYKYDIFDFEVFQKRIKRKAKRERFFSIFTDYGHCVASTTTRLHPFANEYLLPLPLLPLVWYPLLMMGVKNS